VGVTVGVTMVVTVEVTVGVTITWTSHTKSLIIVWHPVSASLLLGSNMSAAFIQH
jgi:hypothetical protein